MPGTQRWRVSWKNRDGFLLWHWGHCIRMGALHCREYHGQQGKEMKAFKTDNSCVSWGYVRGQALSQKAPHPYGKLYKLSRVSAFYSVSEQNGVNLFGMAQKLLSKWTKLEKSEFPTLMEGLTWTGVSWASSDFYEHDNDNKLLG